MVQARLIAYALLCAGLLAVTLEPGRRIVPEGDGPALEDGGFPEADFRGCDRDWNRVNDFWTADGAGLNETAEPEVVYEGAAQAKVAGEYKATSTKVLMPGTDNALRVIEFTRDSLDEVPE